MSGKPYVIVVGTDYSEMADRALRVACAQARRQGGETGAELHVVHALAESDDNAIPILGEERTRLVEHVGSVVSKLPSSPDASPRVIAHVIVDLPMLALTGLASHLEADLIVVGTHGRHGIARWLLGSVAEGVVRHAGCAVMVIPPSNDALKAPSIEPPCPECVAARRASNGQEMWCAQHREHHGRLHTYHQGDRAGAGTNMPLVVR